jgi:hypothetical protein
MHAMIHVYPRMAGQAGRFAVHRAELERMMRDVPGLVSYHLLETAEGVAAMVVCRDRAGCDACAERAARWMDQRLPDLAGREPLVVSGEVIAEAAS